MHNFTFGPSSAASVHRHLGGTVRFFGVGKVRHTPEMLGLQKMIGACDVPGACQVLTVCACKALSVCIVHRASCITRVAPQ